VRVSSPSPPLEKWFFGGEVNTCYNALDRHVQAGKGARTALIYDSPVTSTVQVSLITQVAIHFVTGAVVLHILRTIGTSKSIRGRTGGPRPPEGRSGGDLYAHDPAGCDRYAGMCSLSVYVCVCLFFFFCSF
jgi:hypothetical protein